MPEYKVLDESKVVVGKNSKKTKIIAGVMIGIAVIIAILGFIFYRRSGLPSPSLDFLKGGMAKTYSLLDGTIANPTVAKRVPVAIMVENLPPARPQSGLSEANIVYEAITEGGITRYMALFQTHDPQKVGPVRSARTYFIDWLSEYIALYAHYGGNLDALDIIKADPNIHDLDQFQNPGPYWREPKAGKASEHTAYVSPTKLRELGKQKGWILTLPSNFVAFNFRDDIDETSRPSQGKITINFSSPSYLVDWKYQPKSNTYLRYLVKSADIDELTNKQIEAKNIIIQQVNRTYAPTAINEEGYAMEAIGTGKAKVCFEGTCKDATWSKTDRTSRTIFTDAAGKQFQFPRGQFWYEIVPPETQVTIQ